MKFVPKIVISFGVGFLTLAFFAFLFLPDEVLSESPVFLRGLGLGDKGVDVLRLQRFFNDDPDTRVAVSGAGSSGLETDHFGSLTRAAVHKFQKKYASDILYVGQASTGRVGPKTLRKINLLLTESQANALLSVPYGQGKGLAGDTEIKPKTVLAVPTKALLPEVFGVSPMRVRAGDRVTVNGANFSPTGNTVHIRFGQIEAWFSNLPSVGGKMISFTYQPPDVKTMTKEEILALPTKTLQGLLGPVEAAGGSIDDIVSPYRNLRNEEDLKVFLNKNGHSFDELYYSFSVTVRNSGGQVSSGRPVIVQGLRKLSIGGGLSVSEKDSFFLRIFSLFDSFTPKAYAQGTAEGGYNSGIIMECTCADGYLTFIMDYSSNGGSGLYWWPSSFQATVGDPMMSGPHLGFFRQNAGTCVVGVDPYCAEITANMAQLPWGEAPIGGGGQ